MSTRTHTILRYLTSVPLLLDLMRWTVLCLRPKPRWGIFLFSFVVLLIPIVEDRLKFKLRLFYRKLLKLLRLEPIILFLLLVYQAPVQEVLLSTTARLLLRWVE